MGSGVDAGFAPSPALLAWRSAEERMASAPALARPRVEVHVKSAPTHKALLWVSLTCAHGPGLPDNEGRVWTMGIGMLERCHQT